MTKFNFVFNSMVPVGKPIMGPNFNRLKLLVRVGRPLGILQHRCRNLPLLWHRLEIL